MPEDDDVKDLRGAVRRSFVTFCWYSVIGDRDAGNYGLARSCDFSSTGVGLLTSRPIPRGVHVFIEVASPRGQLSAVGLVMFCRPEQPSGYRVGLSLEIVPPSDLHLLESMSAR